MHGFGEVRHRGEMISGCSGLVLTPLFGDATSAGVEQVSVCLQVC